MAELPRVCMDRTLIRRVLRYIVENAARYSPPGSPIAIRAARDEYRLLVTITDQGSGIEPADQPYIFDKYFRGRSQQKHSSGSGMGLAIAKAMMEAHGGGIGVSSRPEEGASFTLWPPFTSSC